MRPRREPGAAGLPEDPGLTPGAMADGPARKGGVSRSGFTEVFRIDVRPLLHAHRVQRDPARQAGRDALDRKSTRLNSSHSQISYAVFCLKKKKNQPQLAQMHAMSVHGA